MVEPTRFLFWKHLAMHRALVLLRDGTVHTLVGVHRHSGKVTLHAVAHRTVLAVDIVAVSTTDGWRSYQVWSEALIALATSSMTRLPASCSGSISPCTVLSCSCATAHQLDVLHRQLQISGDRLGGAREVSLPDGVDLLEDPNMDG